MGWVICLFVLGDLDLGEWVGGCGENTPVVIFAVNKQINKQIKLHVFRHPTHLRNKPLTLPLLLVDRNSIVHDNSTRSKHNYMYSRYSIIPTLY